MGHEPLHHTRNSRDPATADSGDDVGAGVDDTGEKITEIHHEAVAMSNSLSTITAGGPWRR